MASKKKGNLVGWLALLILILAAAIVSGIGKLVILILQYYQG